MPFQARSAIHRFLKGTTHPAVVIALMSLLLIPVLYAGRYNHPSSDDYNNSIWTSYFDAQVQIYLGWTGRYFSSMILTLNPLHWHSLAGYRIAAGVLIILFSVSFFVLVDKLLSAYTLASGRIRTIIAAATIILLFNNLISLAEGFYWFSGAMTYTLSAILFAWLLFIAAGLDRNENARPPAKRYILAVALLIATIGGNEIIMVLADAFCLCLLIYYHHRGVRSLARFYLLLCVVCLVCSAVAIVAPGNTVRQSGAYQHLLLAMPSWLYFSKELFLEWISDPFLLLFSLLVLCFYRHYQFRRTSPNLLTAFLLPMAVVFLLVFPGFWILGWMPPARARNIIYIFFVIGWIFFLLNLSACLQKLWDQPSARTDVIRQLLGVLALVGLMASFEMQRIRASNYAILLRNFTGHVLQDYDAELNHRYALIRQAAGDTVVVPPIRHQRGNILHFADIGINPDIFPNVYFAAYWGKSKIYRTPDTSAQGR